MTIDVPYLAKPRLRAIQHVAQRVMIGTPIGFDPRPDLGGPQFSVVKRIIRRAHPPDQPVAQSGLFAWRQRVRPRFVDQLRIDIHQRPVRIDIGPRKKRSLKTRPTLRYIGVKFINERIFRFSNHVHWRDAVKVRRIIRTAMGRIEDDRRRRPVGPFDVEHAGNFCFQIVRHVRSALRIASAVVRNACWRSIGLRLHYAFETGSIGKAWYRAQEKSLSGRARTMQARICVPIQRIVKSQRLAKTPSRDIVAAYLQCRACG